MKAQMFNEQVWYPLAEHPHLEEDIENLLTQAGFQVLNQVEHHFQPYGYTGLWLLGESHLAIHTFPEEGRGYLELSSCVRKPFDEFVRLATGAELVDGQ